MNDIDKLFEAIATNVDENSDPAIRVYEQVNQKPNDRLRELIFLFLEGCAFATKQSNDLLLEKHLADLIQQFWYLLPKEKRKELERSRGVLRTEAPYEFWKTSFQSEEQARLLWELINPDQELNEIKSSIDETIQNLENRVETLELTILQMAQRLKIQTLPEETI